MKKKRTSNLFLINGSSASGATRNNTINIIIQMHMATKPNAANKETEEI